MLMTILAGVVCVVAAVVPSGLRTELIEDTETVYSGGYRTTASLGQVTDEWKRGNLNLFQAAAISSPHPSFGWRLPAGMDTQEKYRILRPHAVFSSSRIIRAKAAA